MLFRSTTRRPQDLSTRVYEQCEILCLFPIDAPNAIAKYEEYSQGLGEAVKNLGYGSHDFILKFIGQPPVVAKVWNDSKTIQIPILQQLRKKV